MHIKQITSGAISVWLLAALLTGTIVYLNSCKGKEGEEAEESGFRVVESFTLKCGESKNVAAGGNFISVTNPGDCKTIVELMHRGGSPPPLETIQVPDSSSMTIQAGSVYGEARIRCVGETPNGECQYSVSTKSTSPGEGAFHIVNGHIPLECNTSKIIYSAFNTRPTIVRVKFTSTCGGNNDNTTVEAGPMVNGVAPDVRSTGDGYIVISPSGNTGRMTLRARCNGDGNSPCTAQILVN